MLYSWGYEFKKWELSSGSPGILTGKLLDDTLRARKFRTKFIDTFDKLKNETFRWPRKGPGLSNILSIFSRIVRMSGVRASTTIACIQTLDFNSS